MYAYWDRPSEERVVTVWILIRAGWAPAAPSVRSRFRKLAVAHGAISWNTIPVAGMSPWGQKNRSLGTPPPLRLAGCRRGPPDPVPTRPAGSPADGPDPRPDVGEGTPSAQHPVCWVE